MYEQNTEITGSAPMQAASNEESAGYESYGSFDWIGESVREGCD